MLTADFKTNQFEFNKVLTSDKTKIRNANAEILSCGRYSSSIWIILAASYDKIQVMPMSVLRQFETESWLIYKFEMKLNITPVL